MVIAGDDQVGAAGQGTFQDPVVCGVFGDYLQADLGADDLGDSDHKFQIRHNLQFLPLQVFPKNACDLTQDGRGHEQNEVAVNSLLPNPKRRALRCVKAEK